jgi:hypothetical protein
MLVFQDSRKSDSGAGQRDDRQDKSPNKTKPEDGAAVEKQLKKSTVLYSVPYPLKIQGIR